MKSKRAPNPAVLLEMQRHTETALALKLESLLHSSYRAAAIKINWKWNQVVASKEEATTFVETTSPLLRPKS
jgi:hypothetical protein